MIKTSKNGPLLAEDERAANAMGLTYGKYRALFYKPEAEPKPLDTPPVIKHQKDYHRFQLWQKGLSDIQIAELEGKSRVTITKWRLYMEIPPANKCDNRDDYCYEETTYGPFIVLKDSNI